VPIYWDPLLARTWNVFGFDPAFVWVLAQCLHRESEGRPSCPVPHGWREAIPVHAGEPERLEFAEELPSFVAEIKRIFTPHQILEFFDDVQAGLVPDPAKVFNLDFEEGELDEHEVLNDADRILIIENAKRLSLG
jgi:hypothetical protein